MNDLSISYTEEKHLSPRRRRMLAVLGIILIVSSILLFIYQLSRELNLSLLIPAVANLLLALVVFLQAAEHPILYPEKYIRISGNSIEFKMGRLFRLIKVDWDSIHRVEMKKNAIHLHTTAGRIRLSMLHFPAPDEIKIRSAIKTLANHQGKDVAGVSDNH